MKKRGLLEKVLHDQAEVWGRKSYAEVRSLLHDTTHCFSIVDGDIPIDVEIYILEETPRRIHFIICVSSAKVFSSAFSPLSWDTIVYADEVG